MYASSAIEGSLCLSLDDGFFQLYTAIAMELEKSSGFGEGDVVFASEIAQLVVLGFRNGTTVGSANLLVIGHNLSSKNADLMQTR
jgi:hypothetical protein